MDNSQEHTVALAENNMPVWRPVVPGRTPHESPAAEGFMEAAVQFVSLKALHTHALLAMI